MGTEWYRGAYEEILHASVELIETGGYPPLLSIADAIADRLRSERDCLYEFAMTTIDAADALGNTPEAQSLIDTLRTSLDAYRSFDMDVAAQLPEDVFRFTEQPWRAVS